MQIIGKGRIGTALHKLNSNVKLIGRDDFQNIDSHQLTMIATRNDDLEPIIEAVKIPAESLLFIQNGMLTPYLESKNLSSANRGMIYFAVSKLGDLPSVGESSLFCGPKANEIVHFLNEIDIAAKVVSVEEFKKVEMEKLIWICTFSLLSHVHNLNVSDLILKKSDQVFKLISEFSIVAKEHGIIIGQEEVDTMINYSNSIPDYQGSVKEFDWRNGWFFKENPKLVLHKELLEKINMI